MEKGEDLTFYNRSRTWLSRTLSSLEGPRLSPGFIAACAIIFLLTLGVRFIHWEDYQLNIATDQSSLVQRYKQQAQRMLDGDGILFPRDYEQHQSVQLLVHPPGYSIFVAGVFGLFGKSDNNLVLAQILCDSLAAVLVFLIGAELLPLGAATIAGGLVAFSPHLAHHSLLLLPESLAVASILLAVFLAIRARKKHRLVTVLTAGAMVGVACWLRSNNLLLAPLLALIFFITFERTWRLKHAAAFLSAAIVVISPITIRNWIVFGHFIPLSLGAGITMIEGIGDYDKENRFGMPVTDDDAQLKDMQWHNRPDYVTLWRPDGIERDRYRFARGAEVIRGNPIWFAGVMLRRASSMLRYNDSLTQGWPADTSQVPIVSREAPFGHKPATSNDPVWSRPAAQLLAEGRILSSGAECVLNEDRNALLIAGDGSVFGDQFASALIPVERNTDYILRVPLRLIAGRAAARVSTADGGVALASHILEAQSAAPGESSATGSADRADEDRDNNGSTKEDTVKSVADVVMPFATGNRTALLLVISNNGQSDARAMVALGQADLYELGATPNQWERFLRPALRGIERNVYTTTRMLTLVGMGIMLLGIARRWRTLLILLAVPAYYLLVQSAFHTEYRYILAIHYFLFVIVAVSIVCFGKAAMRASRWAGERLAALAQRMGL